MNNTNKNFLYVTSIIAISFLWTSCGYLSWLYNLIKLTSAQQADFLSEILGYLFQALGILFMVILSRKLLPSLISDTTSKMYFSTFCIMDLITIVFASSATALTKAIILGFTMNFLHGIVAYYYLLELTRRLDSSKRALSFGLGYGIASIASWFLSKIGDTNFLTTKYSFIVYAVLVICLIIIMCLDMKSDIPNMNEDSNYKEPEEVADTSTSVGIQSHENTSLTSIIILAVFAITLLTIARGIGFYFPSADLSKGVNLELSRAFYAIGLVCAGIICDKKRAYGAIASLIALAFPFIMLALSNEINTSIIFWILSYVFYGFLNVYRIVLFSDIADSNGKLLYLSGFGLLFGRVGDAVGAYLGIQLCDNHTALVISSAVIFAVVIILFFALYNKLYMNITIEAANEDDSFFNFSQTYSISAREQEVLKLVLERQSNSEIASNLFISENTVKFHIRNMLKKTNCANRNEIISLYKSYN